MSSRIFTINDKYSTHTQKKKKEGIFFFLSMFIQIFSLDCWKIHPDERPTFSDLLKQINTIITMNYTTNEINHMKLNDESYQSLQNDWRQEIQDIFNELKEKEQVKLRKRKKMKKR